MRYIAVKLCDSCVLETDVVEGLPDFVLGDLLLLADTLFLELALEALVHVQGI